MENIKPKLIVTGLAKHGKDTACSMLAEHGFNFTSSSQVANEIVVFSVLKDKYGYTTLEQCFEDRVNHRKEWADIITAYNRPDRAKLGSYIFSYNDIYCGLRKIEELQALKEKFPELITIWIDATLRKGITEDKESITITAEDCDIRIFNNTTEVNLKKDIGYLVNLMEWCNVS